MSHARRWLILPTVSWLLVVSGSFAYAQLQIQLDLRVDPLSSSQQSQTVVQAQPATAAFQGYKRLTRKQILRAGKALRQLSQADRSRLIWNGDKTLGSALGDIQAQIVGDSVKRAEGSPPRGTPAQHLTPGSSQIGTPTMPGELSAREPGSVARATGRNIEAQAPRKLDLRVEPQGSPQPQPTLAQAQPAPIGSGAYDRRTGKQILRAGEALKPLSRADSFHWKFDLKPIPDLAIGGIRAKTLSVGISVKDAPGTSPQRATARQPVPGINLDRMQKILVENGEAARGSSATTGLTHNQVGGRVLIPSTDAGKSNLRVYGSGIRPTSNDLVVAIQFSKPDGSDGLCTGTLLGARTVLTAAHCACGRLNSYQIIQADRIDGPALAASHLAGAPILFLETGCGSQAKFEAGTDLALLKLENDMKFDAAELPLIPSSWPLSVPYKKGKKLTVVGFGLTEAGESGRRNLGEVPVLTAHCDNWNLYGRLKCAPFAEMILAESTSTNRPNDTCGGDSGGPVFDFVSGPSSQYGPVPILIAVTSRAAPFTHTDTGNHCGGGGIYTVLGRNSVETWLKRHIPELRFTQGF